MPFKPSEEHLRIMKEIDVKAMKEIADRNGYQGPRTEFGPEAGIHKARLCCPEHFTNEELGYSVRWLREHNFTLEMSILREAQ